MHFNNLQDLSFRLSLLLTGVSLLVALALLGWHLYDNSNAVSSAKDVARETAQDAAMKIGESLSILTIAETIASDLTNNELTDREVETRLIRELELNPEVSAITVCYKPEFAPTFVADANRNRYCPYSIRESELVPPFVADANRNRYCPHPIRDKNGDIIIKYVEDDYDYTLPVGSLSCDGTPIANQWYHGPLEEAGPVWGEPYFGAGTKVYWAGFGAPFYRIESSSQERVPAGIVDVAMTLSRFQELVASVDLKKRGAGYGFILSNAGTFISHPIDDFVVGEKTISDFESSLNIDQLRLLTQGATGVDTIILDHTDANSGSSSWVLLAPVAPAGWWVGIVLDKQAIPLTEDIANRLRHQNIGIAMAVLAFLSFVSVVVFRAYRGTTQSLWAVVVWISFLCLAGIGYLWYLNITGSSSDDDQDIILVDRAISRKVIADFVRGAVDPILIPTGVFVQSIELSTANNAIVTGYIWQKYPQRSPDWLTSSLDGDSPGFILPEAQIIEVNEAYRRTDGNDEIIGWYFRAVLRQQFDYSRFPFDREDIRIRLRHKDFDQGVLLTPDLISYTTTDPDLLPGLEKEHFVLEGWNLENSFFSYRQHSYNTNFGVRTFVGQKDSPELYFHVIQTRQFEDAFISNIVPLTVVSILLFAIQLITTVYREQLESFGFTTSAVLAYCAALFFVVVISHLGLRSNLAAPQGIIYLEFFYFVMYAAILLVSLNSLLFVANVNIFFVQYRDNLIMDLLFWPALLGVLLIITIFAFV